jgi:hypothetical protein
MNITVRNGVFETNSSSTHSIVIPKKDVTEFPKSIEFCQGDYGWEFEQYSLPNYLYTAIRNSRHVDEYIEKLKSVLDKHNIEYTFNDSYEGYIDHEYELEDFLEAVFSDEDLLLRCLFGNSAVYTGNDNSGYAEDDADGCMIAREEYYDSDKNEYVGNPYHDETKYDYFFKGN